MKKVGDFGAREKTDDEIYDGGHHCSLRTRTSSNHGQQLPEVMSFEATAIPIKYVKSRLGRTMTSLYDKSLAWKR
jgi:hypothetical protein